ncbi:MAG: hypothetical protein R3C15_02120 [Thermoleophilia bacterium]
MKEVGFDLKIEKQPRAKFDQRKYAKKGELQFFVDNLDTPGIPTPDYYFGIYAAAQGFLNFFGYTNPAVDALFPQLADPAKRADAIKEGQRILQEDLIVHTLAYTGKQYGLAKGIQIPSGHTGNQLVQWQDLIATA